MNHNKDNLKKWIQDNLIKRKSVNWNYTSYELKHIYEDLPNQEGCYFHNDDFKEVMIECGFEEFIIKKRPMNPSYCISEKSPAFK